MIPEKPDWVSRMTVALPVFVACMFKSDGDTFRMKSGSPFTRMTKGTCLGGRVPPVAFTATAYCVADVEELEATFRITLTVCPEDSTNLVALRDSVRPVGELEVVKLTMSV